MSFPPLSKKIYLNAFPCCINLDDSYITNKEFYYLLVVISECNLLSEICLCFDERLLDIVNTRHNGAHKYRTSSFYPDKF